MKRASTILHLFMLFAVVFVTLLFAACGHDNNHATLSGGVTNTAATTVQLASCPSGTANVVMQNEAFVPDSITVQARTSVKWTNNDAAGNYWVIIGNFESPRVGPGQSICLEFTAPGTYEYHCDPLVRGTVIVQPAAK